MRLYGPTFSYCSMQGAAPARPAFKARSRKTTQNNFSKLYTYLVSTTHSLPLSAPYLLTFHPAVSHTPASSAQLEADPPLTLTAQVLSVPLATRFAARGALSPRYLLGREGLELLPAVRHSRVGTRTPHERRATSAHNRSAKIAAHTFRSRCLLVSRNGSACSAGVQLLAAKLLPDHPSLEVGRRDREGLPYVA